MFGLLHWYRLFGDTWPVVPPTELLVGHPVRHLESHLGILVGFRRHL